MTYEEDRAAPPLCPDMIFGKDRNRPFGAVIVDQNGKSLAAAGTASCRCSPARQADRVHLGMSGDVIVSDDRIGATMYASGETLSDVHGRHPPVWNAPGCIRQQSSTSNQRRAMPAPKSGLF